MRVIKTGSLLSTPFVSLTVDSSGERGLLGIAFDPNFATNHYLYVYYTVVTSPLHNRVSRFTAAGDTGRAGQRRHYPGTGQSQLRHQPQWRRDPFTFAFQPGTPGSSSMMLASPPGKKSMTALPVRTTAGPQRKVRPAIHPSAVRSTTTTTTTTTTTMVTARPIDWRKAQQINSSASTVRNGRSDTLVWQVERGRDGISWKSIY